MTTRDPQQKVLFTTTEKVNLIFDGKTRNYYSAEYNNKLGVYQWKQTTKKEAIELVKKGRVLVGYIDFFSIIASE